MKQLTTKSLFSLVITMLFIGIMTTSCSTNGQNKVNEPVSEVVSEKAPKAPSSTIHEAAFMGNLNQIKAHINAGSDLNAKDPYGSSALTIAALFDKPEVARLLIDAGADINITSADGSTPLHSAAFFCRKEIVAMLLEKGADITIRNNYGAIAIEPLTAPFSDVKPIYDQMSKDLGPLGLKLDYAKIQELRPVIADMIRNN